MKNVLVCAVPYSDNLGDGVIYEVLAKLIRNGSHDVSVSALDIAGRHHYGEQTLKRAASGKLISSLPRAARQAAVLALFGAKYLRSWRREWKQLVDSADSAVIGGGQLFSDVDLNFPYKLFLLGRLLKGKPCSVMFVGVASRWSPIGRALVRQFAADARPTRWIVRDEKSKANLVREIGVPAEHVRIAPDPVVSLGALGQRATPGSRRVGLCVSDPQMLAHSAFRDTRHHADAEQGYRDLALFLAERGLEVVLFTNGAHEDDVYLQAIIRRFPELARFQAVYPEHPDELIDLIAGCALLVGHRMHANIIAYALGIPSVGFAWDDKVVSFFQSAGRGEFVLEDLSDPRLRPLLEKMTADLDRFRVNPETLSRRVETEIADFRRSLGASA
jgi:polysaccharide pyruvyl transferase WcaK-like protein